MPRYVVSFTMKNDIGMSVPTDDFSRATELAKALIKNKLLYMVSIVNTKTGGTTDYYSADLLEK